MEPVKTWIEGLDEVVGGGLPEKSFILMMEEQGLARAHLHSQIYPLQYNQTGNSHLTAVRIA